MHLGAIINVYGDGQHPFADDNSLSFFEIDYVEEVLQVAWDLNPVAVRRKVIKKIREGLGISVK